MKIYQLTGASKYASCVVNSTQCMLEYEGVSLDDCWFRTVSGPQGDSWWPRILERITEDDYPVGDYVFCANSYAVIRKEAIEVLKPVLGNSEILPLRCDFGDYWYVNVLDVLDCLDLEASEYSTLPPLTPGGRQRILWISKHVFIPKRIQGHHIFKLSCQSPRGSHVYVDEVFKKHVQKQGITGMKFKLVWEG